jgi:hypothetical protein
MHLKGDFNIYGWAFGDNFDCELLRLTEEPTNTISLNGFANHLMNSNNNFTEENNGRVIIGSYVIADKQGGTANLLLAPKSLTTLYVFSFHKYTDIVSIQLYQIPKYSIGEQYRVLKKIYPDGWLNTYNLSTPLDRTTLMLFDPEDDSYIIQIEEYET